jgi:hypothetical protein
MPRLIYLGIGINYINTSYALNGCINDVQNMDSFLKSISLPKKYTYKSFLLTDHSIDQPTKQNIISYLINVLNMVQSNDIFIFHYSGHGSQIKDLNRDEIDKLDEVIVPIDFNYIIDDEMNVILQKYCKPNIISLFLFDSCHSGTMLDLSNLKSTKSFPLNIISISGCKDNQTSADALIDNNYNGAMTKAFLLHYSKSYNFYQLVLNMRQWLKKNRFSQIPQLSYTKSSLISSYLFPI